MSAYSNISKVVGWEPRSVEIPSINEAKVMLTMVKEQHCRNSFKQALEIHRFAKACTTEAEFAAMKIIYEAVDHGTNVLKRYFQ